MLRKISIAVMMLVAVCAMNSNAQAQANTSVTLSKVHICCGKCVTGINKAADSVKGLTSITINKKAGTVIINAMDSSAAQAAVDAIAKAGFHGTSSLKGIAQKDLSVKAKGEKTRMKLTGVHNCCGGCNRALNKAVSSVKGVQANTLKVKADLFCRRREIPRR